MPTLGVEEKEKEEGLHLVKPWFWECLRGKVKHIPVLEHIEGADVLETIKDRVDRGSVFYSDKFRSYKSLFVFGRHYSLDHAEKFANGRVHINGLEGFWSFAKERMLKYHGISKRHFALYLKELEFRYNHRTQDLLEIFTEL